MKKRFIKFFLVTLAVSSFFVCAESSHAKLMPNKLGPNMLGPNRLGTNRLGPNRMGPNRLGTNRLGTNMSKTSKVSEQDPQGRSSMGVNGESYYGLRLNGIILPE